MDSLREEILALVRQMADQYPGRAYCEARQDFGLLSRIKALRHGCYPTAKMAWESCGLVRDDLVRCFEARALETV
jgi:hypothetical protein